MITIKEGDLIFIFDKGIKVLNYDKKDSFYTKKFQKILIDNEFKYKKAFEKICGSNYQKKIFKKSLNEICPKSISAVDIIAYNETTAYFIEVKDYRNPRVEEKNFHKLILTIVKNCLDSYSGIIGMQFSKDKNEQKIAKEILSREYIEFIFHIEIPQNSNKFDKEAWNLANIQDLIEKRNNFAYRIRVVSKDSLPKSLPWRIEEKNATP